MSKNAALKQRTAYLSIISNTTLVVLKLIVGIYVGAVSLISEALHSGVDLIAALIAFWAVRKSVTPPDMEHDYGHGKYENLSAAVEAVLIVAAALGIVYEAVDKFHESAVPDQLLRLAPPDRRGEEDGLAGTRGRRPPPARRHLDVGRCPNRPRAHAGHGLGLA